MTTNSNPLVNNAYNKLKRTLLMFRGHINTANTLVQPVSTYVDLLDSQQIEELLRLSVDVYKQRTGSLVLAIVALSKNKLLNPKHNLKTVIQNPQMLSASLGIYCLVNKRKTVKPIANPLKKALAERFVEFNDYQIQRGNTLVLGFKLTDVVKLVHPVPNNEDQANFIKKLLEETLEPLDNWETIISNSKEDDRRFHWTRLLLDRKVKDLSLLRNLRNLLNLNVKKDLICTSLSEIDLTKVELVDVIKTLYSVTDKDIVSAIEQLINQSTNKILNNKSLIVFDVSGSMMASIPSSSLTGFTRLDAATMMVYALAKQSQDCVLVFTAGKDSQLKHYSAISDFDFNNSTYSSFKKEVNTFYQALGRGGIFTKQCLDWCSKQKLGDVYRTIVISDSIDCDKHNKPAKPFTEKSHLINIALVNNQIKTESVWTSEINNYFNDLPSFLLKLEQF